MVAGMETGIASMTDPGRPSVDGPPGFPLLVADGATPARLDDRPQTLLIIDDEERLSEVAALLSTSGIAVACLSDPFGADRVARSGHSFAAILLDVLLPTRELYRLCRQLRSFGPVPLVIASWEDRTDLEAGPHDRIVPHSSSAAELAETVLVVVASTRRSVQVRD